MICINYPRVAVIMSVYIKDELRNLKQAVNSILNQTYCHTEFFICIDGPILQEVSSYLNDLSESGQVVIVENENNKGLACSLNLLIDKVLSDSTPFKYFLRMDADDISLPNRVEKQVSFMELNPHVDVSGGFCEEFGSSYSLSRKELPLSHEELQEFSVYRCPFIHPTVIFKNSVFLNGFRYPENTSFTEDMALWLILLESNFKFSNIPDVLIKYRMTEDAVSRRLGYKKGMSEFSVRYNYMMRNGKFSLINFARIFFRLIFHIMPISLVKFIYRKMR